MTAGQGTLYALMLSGGIWAIYMLVTGVAELWRTRKDPWHPRKIEEIGRQKWR